MRFARTSSQTQASAQAAVEFKVIACPGLQTAQSRMTHSLSDTLHLMSLMGPYGKHVANSISTFSTISLSDFAEQNQDWLFPREKQASPTTTMSFFLCWFLFLLLPRLGHAPGFRFLCYYYLLSYSVLLLLLSLGTTFIAHFQRPFLVNF